MQLPQLRIMDARAPAKVLQMIKRFAIRKLRIGGEMTSFARLENTHRQPGSAFRNANHYHRIVVA